VARSIPSAPKQTFSDEKEEGNTVLPESLEPVSPPIAESPVMVPSDAASQTSQLKRLEPVIRTIARQVVLTGKTGTIELDDLLQVGRIAALKQIKSYIGGDHGNSLETWCSFRITREIKEHVRMQSADVTVSDHAQRGHLGAEAAAVEVEIHSRDKAPAHNNDSRTKVSGSVYERENTTPEDLYSAAEGNSRLKAAIDRLPSDEKEIVQWVFGIGVPEKSVRELANVWGIPRARLDATLKRAKAKLAAILGDE
jgi:RNA polymerase sigma factor (sigma-70 family)